MIKQMSLIALGAATLFMAPTVVHAENSRGAKTPISDITITDVGQNEITSAPEFKFGSKSNFDDTRDIRIGGVDDLEVTIQESETPWDLTVKRTPFSTEKGGTLKATSGKEEVLQIMGGNSSVALTLPENGYEHNNPTTSLLPEGMMTINNSPQSILTASGHSVGIHKLSFKNGSIRLDVPNYSPAGHYTSTITWALTNTP